MNKIKYILVFFISSYLPFVFDSPRLDFMVLYHKWKEKTKKKSVWNEHLFRHCSRIDCYYKNTHVKTNEQHFFSFFFITHILANKEKRKNPMMVNVNISSFAFLHFYRRIYDSFWPVLSVFIRFRSVFFWLFFFAFSAIIVVSNAYFG